MSQRSCRRPSPGRKFGAMKRSFATTALFLSSSDYVLDVWAFPLQKSFVLGPTNKPHSFTKKFIAPSISKHVNKRHPLRVSMASEDTSEPSNIDDDISFPRPSSKQSDEIDSFDSSIIDWEPMDIDDMDDFFDMIDGDYPGDEYVDLDESDELLQEFDKETLLEILGLEDEGETISIPEDYDKQTEVELLQFAEWDNLVEDSSDQQVTPNSQTTTKSGMYDKGIEDLERALMGGVVPADAGVGSGMLPGDEGFDPWELSTKDYFKQIQNFILNLVPERKNLMDDEEKPEVDPGAGGAMPTVGFVGEEDRPPALILRDYREAEIRHGRLAMLAAVIWPLQEIIDRIFIPDSFGHTTVIYGGPTLPFFPLMMTFLMLNLGYLDIYSSEIKENESGDAFLPGECFWDPLCILNDAPDRMKRNMQEREILNGRAAMIAVAAFIFEEGMTHKPIVALPTNALLFEPLYQVPFIQEWLDLQFGNIDYTQYLEI